MVFSILVSQVLFKFRIYLGIIFLTNFLLFTKKMSTLLEKADIFVMFYDIC